MTNDKGEFRVGNYVRAFEKSLNYMCAVFLAIAIVIACWYFPNFQDFVAKIEEWFYQIKDGDPNGLLLKIFTVIMGAVTVLPYYFYYTLKDNYEWNLYSGRRDIDGLLKIYVLYELTVIGLFYLLFPREEDYVSPRLIVSVIGALLVVFYIVILFYQHKKGEDIGYFLILIILLGLLFGFLIYKNACDIKSFSEQNYGSILFMLLFLLNSFINIIFLHCFDSCAETGIISNRIKIIIPTITFSVYTPALMHCYLYQGINVDMMLAAAVGITLYEVVISSVRFQKTNAKVFGCVCSFAVFVSGMALFIWRFGEEGTREALVGNWFLLIGFCIYMVATKYYGAIMKLQFPKKNDGESKGKIMCSVIWLRNGFLGSMLFFVVNYTVTSSHIWLTIAIIFSASVAEFFACQYVFNTQRDLNPRKSYLIGRAVELIVMLVPVAFFMIEQWCDLQWEDVFGDNPAMLVLVTIVALLTLVIGLYMYILSKYTKGTWEKIPELDKAQVFREIMRRFRDLKIITNNVLHDKNVEDFWMAILSWGLFIAVALLSLFACACGIINPMESSKAQTVQLWGGIPIAYEVLGIIFLMVIVGVDWLFLSRNIFNYYMNKMEEGKMVKKCNDMFQTEWENCLKEMGDFKETDAKQIHQGNYYRPLLFALGATYQSEVDLTQETTYSTIARAACCIELIHKSDTIIDDYIDEDISRNGQTSFHAQYDDTRRMILLRDAFQAKALMTFESCRGSFLCDDDVVASNMALLSQNMYNISSGRYQELALAGYDSVKAKDLEQVVYYETVLLFKNSIGLGYSCFHERQGDVDRKNLENLGIALGKFYQYMNDRAPFVKIVQYQKFKGNENQDIGKKNMVMLRLYERFAQKHPAEEDRKKFSSNDREMIQKLYEEYCLEEEILQEAENEISEMRNILNQLSRGNEGWSKNFKAMFNSMLSERGWQSKLREL